MVVSEETESRKSEELAHFVHSLKLQQHQAFVNKVELREGLARLNYFTLGSVNPTVEVRNKVGNKFVSCFELFIVKHVLELVFESTEELTDKLVAKLRLELLIKLVVPNEVEVKLEALLDIVFDVIVEALGKVALGARLVKPPEPDV